MLSVPAGYEPTGCEASAKFRIVGVGGEDLFEKPVKLGKCIGGGRDHRAKAGKVVGDSHSVAFVGTAVDAVAEEGHALHGVGVCYLLLSKDEHLFCGRDWIACV